jgi:hypothetical protein
MPNSLPSELIHLIDVPEVKDFDAKFVYKFFTPDECIKETTNLPDKFLNKKTNDSDVEYVQYIESKLAKYVRFNWRRPRLVEPNNKTTESDARKNSFRNLFSTQTPTMIRDNYDKIVSEDSLTLKKYANVIFNDGDIESKLYNFTSGSLELQSLLDKRPKPPTFSPTAQASILASKSLSETEKKLVYSSLSQRDISQQTLHYSDKDSSAPSTLGQEPLKNEGIKALKKANVATHINSKILRPMLNRAIKDPFSHYSHDLQNLQKASETLASTARRNSTSVLQDSKFQTAISYIGARSNKGSARAERLAAEIVGYVIDKREILPNGTQKELPSIIIENEKLDKAYDVQVKYGTTYAYSIRTIALFNLPAVDKDSGEIATVQTLVTSKPSATFYVKTEENVAPPPPSDISFNWNYENENLLIHWAYPVNPQRDIKKFQVFRRDNIDQPFELIKEYDFNDSLSIFRPRESVAPGLTTQVNSPVTFYVDEEFNKNSRYIYTVCSIDAHGLTSNYGAQFELSFDVFKNQLVKRLVSHSGAPKPYPNLYLEASSFVSAVNVSGAHTKRMHVYFVPQFYQLLDEEGREHRIISTNQTGGQYKIQFINTDTQKSEVLSIRIEDRTTID